MRRILFCLFLILATALPAAAEPRVALVIGNSKYGGDLPKLANPDNDAELMAATLKKLGFTVVKVQDADLNQMKRAIQDFGTKLTNAGKDAVGLFFYAGHGLQIAGNNYLIPVGAKIEKAADADLEAIDANLVLKQMAFAENSLNILILDACRNNPLSRGMRSASGGLAKMDAPLGTFIAYSTAPDQTAADGDGKNSPYTAALTKAMVKPGIAIEEVFRDARVDVLNATNREQIPWESSSLTGAFYFAPGSQTAASAAPALTPQAAPAAPVSTVPAPSAPAAPAPDTGASKSLPSGGGAESKECGNCPKMLAIQGGAFMMGAAPGERDATEYEQPQKKIAIKSFLIGKFDVTREQFAAFVRSAHYQPSDRCDAEGRNKMSADFTWDRPGMNVYTQTARDPVVCVSWNDANAYVQWLAKITGKPYRLPSEAEWEYAARAGLTGAFMWDDGDDKGMCRYANVADLSTRDDHPNWNIARCNDGHPYTAPVDALKPNAFGVHGMLGNVKQWVADCPTPSPSAVPADGTATGGDCADHMIRGSAWNSPPPLVRFAYREHVPSDYAANNLGFRVALDQ
jgi:formylglycine-generating enzyme required for sulfatase activity